MHRDEHDIAEFTVDDAHRFACRLRGDPGQMGDDVPSPRGVAQWPVKVYEGGGRIRLPVPLPWWSRSTGVPPVDPAVRLSELLFDAAGITRAIWRPGGTAISSPQRPGMVWPDMRLGHRRTVPSGGAMYPIEIYVARLTGDIGVFHYDPAHHELVNLGHPAPRDALQQALDLDGATHPLWVVLTHRFGKNTFKYGNFAYRLGSADLGVIWSRLVTLGGRLFGDVTTHVDFDDAAVDRMCGNHPLDEAAYLLAGFGEAVAGTAERAARSVAPEPPAVLTRGPATALSPTFVAMHRAARAAVGHGRARAGTEIQADVGAPQDHVTGEIQLSIREGMQPPGPRVFATRRSGGACFVETPVAFDVFETVLAQTWATLELLRRTYADGDPPEIQLLCALDRVPSVPAGWYRYDATSSRLVPAGGSGTLPPSRVLQDALHVKTVDLERSAFSIHFAGLLDLRGRRRGARAYRCQQLFVGAGIEAATRWSTACGVGSHPLHGFDSARIDRCYGLDPGRFGVLGQVAVGHTRSNGTLEGTVG